LILHSKCVSATIGNTRTNIPTILAITYLLWIGNLICAWPAWSY